MSRCEQCGRQGTRQFKTLTGSYGATSRDITVCSSRSACHTRARRQADRSLVTYVLTRMAGAGGQS